MQRYAITTVMRLRCGYKGSISWQIGRIWQASVQRASHREPTTVQQKLTVFSSLKYVARGDVSTPYLPEQFHQLTLISVFCHRTLTSTFVLVDSVSFILSMWLIVESISLMKPVVWSLVARGWKKKSQCDTINHNKISSFSKSKNSITMSKSFFPGFEGGNV